MSINFVGLNTPSSTSPNPSQRVSPLLAFQSAGVPLIADPVIDLLKKLLPADKPFGAALEEFRQASALIMDSNLPQDETLLNLITLLRNLPVDLKNPTAEQLHAILDRLGLRYEPMIQLNLAEGFPLSEENLTARNLKAALLELLKDDPPSGIGQGRSDRAIPQPDAAAGEFLQQAQQLLTSIERTQVLNSLNNENGQPLTFQIPFVLDGRMGTAEFYVEQRDGESHEGAAENRHYSVVAFLDLGAIGALRIDLALHQKHLSLKVTVEREETQRFTRGLLLDLKRALDAQGFVVDFLSCERQPDVRVHNEDVRDRALPSESHLISLRI